MSSSNSGLLRGVWAPALTPLDSNLVPDTQKCIEYYKWLLENGCHGIAFMGTNSEAVSFSVAERISLLDKVLEAGILPDQLLVGTGCSALTDTVELTRHATENGCSVLQLPPYFMKEVCDEGLFQSYAQVIDRVGPGVKLYFYHFPKLSGVPITHSVIQRCVEEFGSTICGLKDSSGDEANTAAYLEKFPDLSIFPASEKHMISLVKKGGAGTISAGANIFCTAIRATYDAFLNGNAELDELNRRISDVRDCSSRFPLITTTKAIMAHASGDQSWNRLRPPLVPMSADETKKAAKEFAEAGFKLGG